MQSARKDWLQIHLRGVNVALRGICYEHGVTFARKLSETAQRAVPVSFTLHSFFIHVKL